MVVESSLQYYIELLTHMRTGNSGGFKAPHKAILMLTVTELVRDGVLCSPLVQNDDLLKKSFIRNWHKYIQIHTSFIGDVNMPVTHIGGEKFIVKSNIKSFEIDKELFLIMQDPEDSATIIATLISAYLAPFCFQHRINFNELNPFRDRTLRDYQSEGKAKIYQMWIQMRSIMFQMPTGTGKTKLFVSIARDLFDWGAQRKIAVKILFLAHRIELLDQISENLGIKYNLAHAMIASQSREQKKYPLQIASVQTLIRRLDRWKDKDFDVIIIDEAHHVKADSYKKILQAFPHAKVLGVTATPYRMSHESFRPEFDELITSAPISRFIRDKWLCDYEYYSIRPESRIQMDIDSISRFALDGDYLDEAAAAIMDKDEIRAGIVSTYERYAKGKKGIIYTVNKVHNYHVCSQFISKGYRAVAIDDKTPSDIRKRYVEDFKRNKIDIICNVNIFSEGFDCPDLEFIQLARPTKSLSMYLQQVGRGLRPAEGKDKLIILDNVGLYNRFGFPSARRQWRRHFEGMAVEYTDPYGSRSVDGRKVAFIDDYEEGDEEVEMLHATAEEVTEDPIVADDLANNSNEPEFLFYLKSLRKDDTEIRRIVIGIKSDIDSIIRGKYDSKHESIFKMDSLGILDLYLYDFKTSPVMVELNTVKKSIMTEALSLYIDYLKWRESETTEILTDNFIHEQDNPESCKARSLSDVEAEISIFRKWNRDIPDQLMEEYHKLLKS